MIDFNNLPIYFIDQNQINPMSDKKFTANETGEQAVEYSNEKVKRNNLIFVILSILSQITIGCVYGFQTFPAENGGSIQNIYPIFMTFGYAMFIVAGLGLLISYMKRLVWSGLGFTLLITAMTLQYYFLCNAAFGWAQLQEGNIRVNGQFPIETPNDHDLYRFQISQSVGGVFGNTIIEAFKAAMANVVAFSMVIGRVGLLQIWILVFFGTIGYELNRTLLTNYGWDGPGTMHIFLYGAVLGLVASLILRFRETSEENSTGQHKYYNASKFSSTMGLLGTVICWVFFPFLGLDPIFNQNAFAVYLIPLNIVFALSASTFSAMCMSALFNGKLHIHDMVMGPLAGGVAAATAGAYMTNPVYSLLLGTIAGSLQVILMNLTRSRIGKGDAVPYSLPGSVFLFAFNGLIGAAWAAWNNAVIHTNSDQFTYTVDNINFLALDQSFWEFIIGLLSIAFAIGFGLIIGFCFMLTGQHTRKDHFTDTTYWVDDDGISYPQSRPVPIVNDANSEVEMEFYEGNNQIKNIHAYL